MKIERAVVEDMSRIMELIGQAKRYLNSLGTDQWQDGYPDEDVIRGDLAEENGYVLREAGRIIGYFCVSFEGEPCYETIEGRWKSDRPYGVVHRMAVDDACKGRGLSRQMLQYAETLCLGRGVRSIRIDTHRDNPVMRRIVEKLGYEYCGVVWYGHGSRIAFEKAIG